jgi:hypothetical protein
MAIVWSCSRKLLLYRAGLQILAFVLLIHTFLHKCSYSSNVKQTYYIINYTCPPG